MKLTDRMLDVAQVAYDDRPRYCRQIIWREWLVHVDDRQCAMLAEHIDLKLHCKGPKHARMCRKFVFGKFRERNAALWH